VVGRGVELKVFVASRSSVTGFDGGGRNAGPVSTAKRVKAAIKITGTIQQTKTETVTDG
jgi:hypothetical protein